MYRTILVLVAIVAMVVVPVGCSNSAAVGNHNSQYDHSDPVFGTGDSAEQIAAASMTMTASDAMGNESKLTFQREVAVNQALANGLKSPDPEERSQWQEFFLKRERLGGLPAIRDCNDCYVVPRSMPDPGTHYGR